MIRPPIEQCADDLAEAVGVLALAERMIAPRTEHELAVWRRMRDVMRKHGTTPSGSAEPDE